MTVRTNTANGGTSYIDMDIQVVSEDNSQITLRAVVYLTSRNVSDSTNNLSVTGQWSRSGALALGGVYSASPVWYQDVQFAKVVGVAQQVGWNVSWSAVDYWATTLSGTMYYTIPGAVGAPSTPYGYSARNITSSSAYTTGVTVDSNGGQAFANLQVQWALPGGAGLQTRVMNAFTDGYMDGMSPGTTYDFRVAVSNSTYWSAWGAWARFATLAVVPGTPAAPTVSAITQTTATVSWTAPYDGGSAITSYGVQVATDSAFSNVVIFQGTGALTGLTPGTTYWTRVRAGNAIGAGPYSTATSFTTTPASAPSAPTNLVIDQITNTTARATWGVPVSNGGSAITGYTVFVATDAAFANIVFQANFTTSPGAITGLVPGTTYYVVVYAYNVAGYGAQSTVPSFLTTGGQTINLSLNVLGTWKPGELWLNVQGTWKRIN
jgi:hypothetical protein